MHPPISANEFVVLDLALGSLLFASLDLQLSILRVAALAQEDDRLFPIDYGQSLGHGHNDSIRYWSERKQENSMQKTWWMKQWCGAIYQLSNEIGRFVRR